MLDLGLAAFGRVWLANVPDTADVVEVGIMALPPTGTALALLPCIGDMFGKLVCGGDME